MVTLAPDLRIRALCRSRAGSQCFRHLIGLFIIIHFPNLVLIKLNVRTLSGKEMYANYVSTDS